MANQQGHEVAIVGAGPIGIELAVALRRAGTDCVQFDAAQIGHTISWWPRDTPFFSPTERIAIAGVPIPSRSQERTTGEEYLAYLRAVVAQFDLPIHTYQRVEEIQRHDDGFVLKTRRAAGQRQDVRARKVVLAKGDMDRPHRIGIDGEDLPHVSHYFTDVHPYFRRRVLIVGGRNSASEAALRLWRAGAEVTISYRKGAFDARCVKHWILPDLTTQIELGTIAFHPKTVPESIDPDRATLRDMESERTFGVEADFVLLLTGHEGDMTLYEGAGVKLAGRNRRPHFDPDTMETNVPGLYIAGTTVAGARQGRTRYRLFIENSHVHVGKIVQHITGRWPERLGTIPTGPA